MLRWWFDSGSERTTTPPPLPAWSASDRVLAVLRPDWLRDWGFPGPRPSRSQNALPIRALRRGSFVAGSALECIGSRQAEVRDPRLGSGSPAPRPTSRSGLIDRGTARITRSALLLRGRRLALLGVLVDARGLAAGIGWTVRVSLPPTIAAVPLEGCRGMILSESNRRGSAQVLPIGLPCLPYPTDRGTFQPEDRGADLAPRRHGRRCWLPLLVSWDPSRNRKTLHWRILTVSERSRAVPADRAVRRARELGARRVLCHLSEPGDSGGPSVPRVPDPCPVSGRAVHHRRRGQADRDG